MQWYGNYPSLNLTMTLAQAEGAHHQGQCDESVLALSKVPAIARQLRRIPQAELASELREYGAWDAEDLADHDQNLQRILWLAAGDIVDRAFERRRR